MRTTNNFDIREESLTEELKQVVFSGFSKHATQQTGYDELLPQVAFVAYKDGNFAGTVAVQLFWGALHIKYVFVEEDHRSKGVGKELMLAAIEYGKKHKCPFAFVETMSFQALGFYEKLGFKLEFTRGGYSHGTSFHYLKKDF